MARFDFFRNVFNTRLLIISLALIVAPLLGVAIVAATRGQLVYLIAAGGVIGIFATLYAPIELLILLGILAAVLADSTLVSGDVVYYARFIPMGMLSIRTIIDLVLHRGRAVRSEPSLLLTGLAFVAFAAFSISYTYTPELTPLRVLSMVFVVVGFGLGLPNYLDTPAKFNRALALVVGLISGFVLLGVVISPGAESSTIESETFLRIAGFFSNPNTLGLIAMLVFFPLVWLRQLARNRNEKRLLTVLLGVWVLLIVASGSRGSFVGLVAGSVVLAFLHGRTTLRYTQWIMLGLALTLIFFVAFPELRRVLVFETETTGPIVPGQVRVVDRPFLIQRAIELGMRSPIYGVGFGASDRVFSEDKPYLISMGVYISGSHNSYTRMFVDLGIIGVVLGSGIFAIIIARVVVAPAYIRRDPTLALLTAAVVTGLVNGFFEDWLFGFGNSSTLPFWFLLALVPLRMTLLQKEHAMKAAPNNSLVPAEAAS